MRILSEPLVHFVAIGLLLFLVGGIYDTNTRVYRITVTPQHVTQLANNYARQFGSRPDRQTLDALVQRDLHDEILYRQGLALKLDRDDEIVRRRIVQKMQFLTQDLNAPREPTEQELRAYYDAHASWYVTPPRVSFSHIYFSDTVGGNAAARARAIAALTTLSNSMKRAPERGDPFPDRYDFAAYEPEQVYRLFGHTSLADAVFSAKPGQWTGPFRSSYGWHLIYIDTSQPPVPAPLSEVRDIVRKNYQEEAQDRANAASFANLARRFTIVRVDQATTR
jgi:peptidyl-prolyl cis-trans isomerase C